MPGPEADSAVESANKILRELKRYDEALFGKPRWLVLNKLDLLPDDESEGVCDEITNGLEWSGPVYAISAINGQGVEQLCNDIMNFLENNESI
jgi:GTP-binding protein